jgi:hypothetical protein
MKKNIKKIPGESIEIPLSIRVKKGKYYGDYICADNCPFLRENRDWSTEVCTLFDLPVGKFSGERQRVDPCKIMFSGEKK